jgi:hypothetical protein
MSDQKLVAATVTSQGSLMVMNPAAFVGLSSFLIATGFTALSIYRCIRLATPDHPAKKASDHNTDHEGRRHGFNGVTLNALRCVIDKLLSRIAAPFYGTLYDIYAFVDCICHGRSCT